MDFAAIIVVFSMFWKMSWSIKCYKCEPELDYLNTPLCEHFDYSNTFLVDCKFSTMCFKKDTFLEIGKVKTKSVQRGCAKQLMDGDQEKRNREWHFVNRIYEVYKEECKEDSNDGEKVTKTVHCYCRGSLCNSGGKFTYSIALLTTALWILLG